MLIVTGWGSAIVRALLPMLPVEEEAKRADAFDIPLDGGRYLFCAGVIRPTRAQYQTEAEIEETFAVNCASVIRACDRIIESNRRARICIVGSESGYSWSFDGIYAASKAALHRYVEAKRLETPDQQLVAIAPTIIADAGMTLRRRDQDNVAVRATSHPKARLLTAEEVARWIHFLLYVDHGYASGMVVRLNGGEHIR